MRKIALVSHGSLARGMQEAVELIIGKREEMSSICAYLEPDFDLGARVDELVSGLADGDELLLVSDLLGGSVNNVLSGYGRAAKVYVVTGMSLALVIELAADDDPDTEAVIRRAVETAREGVLYMRDKTAQLGDASDEF